jgi:hypothetical protein
MKYIIITFFAMALTLSACNNTVKTENNPTELKTDSLQAAAVYVCPMHPEVTSKNPDTCSKCGMDLEKK